MIKHLLWLFIFTIPNLSYSKEVKVTLSEGGQVFNCNEEASIDGYFCLDGKNFLIIRSFGDRYLTSGRLNGSSKSKNYLIKRIESDDNTLIYESNYPDYSELGGHSKKPINIYKPPVSLSSQYADLTANLFNLNPPSFPSQEKKSAPTQEYAKFLADTLTKLRMEKDSIAKKFKASSVNVTLTDGSQVTCQRNASKHKSKADLIIEKKSGSEVVCGIFSCGIDKAGNQRILFSHYSQQQIFNDILYINKDGFDNGPQVSAVSVKNDTIPLYSYDYNHNFSLYPYGNNKPEISKDNYLPSNLQNQSNFFNNMNQPNYEMILRDSGRLCKKSSWKNFNSAFEKYKEKLITAKLVQYITSVNGILTGYYLPTNQIPDIACNEDGTYYNPQFFSSAKEFSKSFDPKAITKEKSIELFNLAQNMKDIAWDYKEDGCYARAHLMARRFEAMGIQVDKAWLKGDLAYKENGKIAAEWNFHVAPVVYVESKDGKIEKYIIDPSTFDRPVPVKLWASQLNKSKREINETHFPFPENSLMYERTSLAFSNTTPYLPTDAFKTTEKDKLHQAAEAMELYLGVSQ